MKLFGWLRRTRVERALDPETGKPIPYSVKQWLQGKLTYISLIITGIGYLARAYGWTLPVDEVKTLLDSILAHWDDIAAVVGAAGVVYGRARREWQNHHPQQP